MPTQINFGTSGWRAVIAEEFAYENVRCDLFAKVGSFYPLRENFRLTPEVEQKFTEKLRRDPTEFDGMKVARVVRTDGLKLLLADGLWVCYRLSGTEPVVRVYSEARSEEGLAKLSATKALDV
jgi:phosphomannomutase